MAQGQGLWSAEVADLPRFEVDAKPEIVVLVRENEPIGWAFVLPDGAFWLVREDARSVTHGSSLSVLTNFWSAVYDCDVGIPTVKPG